MWREGVKQINYSILEMKTIIIIIIIIIIIT